MSILPELFDMLPPELLQLSVFVLESGLHHSVTVIVAACAKDIQPTYVVQDG